MGVPMLKGKKELNYRKGAQWAECSMCNSYWWKMDAGGPRCKVLGLKPGRPFRISEHSICDAYDNSLKMSRYKK
jgi:hypothetical protein